MHRNRGISNRVQPPSRRSTRRFHLPVFTGYGMNTRLPPPAPLPLAERLLGRVRVAWRRSVLLRVLVLAPALFAAAAVLLVAVDLAMPLRAAPREVLRWLPFALAAGALGWAGWRVARPPSAARLALLAEERIPALGNRLATALEMQNVPDGPVLRAFLEDAVRHLASADLRGVAPGRVRVPGIVLGVALALAAVFALLLPSAAAEAWERWTRPRDAYETRWRELRAEALPRSERAPIPPFDELRWRIEPPSYANLPAVTGRGDDAVAALPGSRIRLWSRFAERWSGVAAARIGGEVLPVRRRKGEWIVEWTQTPAERGVSLEARAGGEVAARRVLPVTVLPDNAPDVALTQPETDLVLASGTGRVAIRATAADDYGVGDFTLTWSRTRGSGESFEYLDGQWAFARVSRPGKTAAGLLDLELAALQLQPGDVIHVRAVARDRNTVTGPGESVSRTRVIRVARPEEMDEVNTDVGFPTELPNNPLLSQRMLILRTERLRARMQGVSAGELREQSADIGHEQSRLRERVGEQVFTRATGGVQDPFADLSFTETAGAGHSHEAETPAAGSPRPREAEVLEEASEATGKGTADEVTHKHDADPILEVNRTLSRIYDLMWASERALNQADPAGSLPHQYAALELIQEMRKTDRLLPRGNVRVDPVDIAAARGEGKLDEAAPTGRAAGVPLPSLAPLLAELDRVTADLQRRTPRVASLELSALAGRLLAAPDADRQGAALVSRAAGEAAAGRTDAARALLRRARGRLAPEGGARTRVVPSTTDPAAAEYFRRLGRTP